MLGQAGGGYQIERAEILVCAHLIFVDAPPRR